MSRLTHVLYGAGLTLLNIAAPAISHADASTATQTRSLSVRYSDLNLERPTDVKALYHRITRGPPGCSTDTPVRRQAAYGAPSSMALRRP